MGSTSSTTGGSASPGKVESPVTSSSATGQTDESNVLDNSELNQLHNQITELHNQVRELQKNIENLEIQLTLARQQKKQLEQQLADVEEKNLELEQLHIIEMGNSAEPNYEVVRDRVLNRLRLGRQSQAGKALDAFIKELLKG